MKNVFEQFHFSLLEIEQGDFFSLDLSREQWLRRVFGQTFSFQHLGKLFYWVPQEVSGPIIVGVIERKKHHRVLTPPDEGALQTQDSYYTGAVVVIDPINRKDGQRVAVQRHSPVGQPAAILKSLVEFVNAHHIYKYKLYAKAIFNEQTFWRFASENGGNLEYVKFRFTVPNMIFGAGGKTKDGLKRIGNDTGAHEIEVKLEGIEGVKADSEAVREGVGYASDGNATITAKSWTGKIWRSSQSKAVEVVDDIIDFSKSRKREIAEWSGKVLGRDKMALDYGFDNPDDWDGIR